MIYFMGTIFNGFYVYSLDISFGHVLSSTLGLISVLWYGRVLKSYVLADLWVTVRWITIYNRSMWISHNLHVFLLNLLQNNRLKDIHKNSFTLIRKPNAVSLLASISTFKFLRNYCFHKYFSKNYIQQCSFILTLFRNLYSICLKYNLDFKGGRLYQVQSSCLQKMQIRNPSWRQSFLAEINVWHLNDTF